jgi:hypothetical protein
MLAWGMFTVCHTEEAELFPPQLLPRCPVYDTISIWFLILFPVLSLYIKYICNTKNHFPPEPKKLTQHHNCMVVYVHKEYVKSKPISSQNKKLKQQHNWKKGSSSPRKASV